jgi:hypothetical protein
MFRCGRRWGLQTATSHLEGCDPLACLQLTMSIVRMRLNLPRHFAKA